MQAIQDEEEREEAKEIYLSRKKVLAKLLVIDAAEYDKGNMDAQVTIEVTKFTMTFEDLREELTEDGMVPEGTTPFFSYTGGLTEKSVISGARLKKTKIRVIEGLNMTEVKEAPPGRVKPMTAVIQYSPVAFKKAALAIQGRRRRREEAPQPPGNKKKTPMREPYETKDDTGGIEINPHGSQEWIGMNQMKLDVEEES